MAYTKNIWNTDDIITADKLNNMENGIQANNSVVGTNLLTGTTNSLNTAQVKGYNAGLPIYTANIFCPTATTFTASAWLHPYSYPVAVQIAWLDENNVAYYTANDFITAGLSGYSTYTVTIPAGGTLKYVTAAFDTSKTDNTQVDYKEFKLEKGSVATPWDTNLSEILTRGEYQALNMPTVKLYGAKGDGINDDTLAIQRAIDSNVNGAIAFPPGTYLINDTININQRCSLHFYGATIRATETMSAMFYTDSTNFESTLKIISMIGDGASCLDLNNKASVGIRASGLILRTFSIKNLPDNAIGIKIDGISKISDIMMLNNISTTGTVGIQFDNTDCRLQHFVPVNIEKGIVVNRGGTYITDYHPWSVIMPVANRSVGIQVNNSWVNLNDYYADTCFKAIEVSGSNTLIIINNFSTLWNTKFYNDQNSSPVPYLFYFNNFSESYKGEHILVSNSVLLNSAKVKGQNGFWSNLTDNSGFSLSNVQISMNEKNINGIAQQFIV